MQDIRDPEKGHLQRLVESVTSDARWLWGLRRRRRHGVLLLAIAVFLLWSVGHLLSVRWPGAPAADAAAAARKAEAQIQGRAPASVPPASLPPPSLPSASDDPVPATIDASMQEVPQRRQARDPPLELTGAALTSALSTAAPGSHPRPSAAEVTVLADGRQIEVVAGAVGPRVRDQLLFYLKTSTVAWAERPAMAVLIQRIDTAQRSTAGCAFSHVAGIQYQLSQKEVGVVAEGLSEGQVCLSAARSSEAAEKEALRKASGSLMKTLSSHHWQDEIPQERL